MKVEGKLYRSLWLDHDGRTVRIIDQRWLPHEFWIVGIATLEEAVAAIRDGQVRGGPLTAAVCAYGTAFAMLEDPSNASLMRACAHLANLAASSAEAAWALREMNKTLLFRRPWERREAAYKRALELSEADVEHNRAIGTHGLRILKDLAAQTPGRRLNIIAPCTAGWLSTVDWGTAMAPIYRAHAAGIPIHVFLDETAADRTDAAVMRWELAGQGVPLTAITTEHGAAMMEAGIVDLVLLGAQSVTLQGDVRNLEPLSGWAAVARAQGVPCYAAVTSTAIGWGGLPLSGDGALPFVSEVAPDITRARDLCGLITERGICSACGDDLRRLFPDRIAA